MTLWIKRHQIYSFFILTFVISWAIWIPIILFLSKDGEFHPLLYIGGYGPFLSAVLVTWIAEGGHGLRQWLKRTFRWRIHMYSCAQVSVGADAYHYLLFERGE